MKKADRNCSGCGRYITMKEWAATCMLCGRTLCSGCLKNHECPREEENTCEQA